MPNHCWNLLEVVDGDLDDLKPYLTVSKTNYGNDLILDFNKIIPMPPDQDEQEDWWYHWRIEHWGTKWNSYEGQENGDGISFSTAWAPPTPVIAALAPKIGKSLRLVYDEPGMDFCGEFLAHPDGSVVDRCYNGRHTAPEELKDDLMIDEEEDFDQAWDDNKE